MKTPEERGPHGAWAYESRAERLGVSPEQVVDRLGRYDAATIRKAEADGRKNMSRPLWRALTKLYTEWAREKGVTLDPIPLLGEQPAAEPSADFQAIVDAIHENSREIRRNADMIARNATATEKLVSVMAERLDLMEENQKTIAVALARGIAVVLAETLGATDGQAPDESTVRARLGWSE